MHAAETSDDVRRLREFWNSRYRVFSLSESGWSGAGDGFNAYVYRCKSAAVTRALSSLAHTPASRFAVLDAGCGQGYFADFYRHRYPHATYVGLDLSERVIAHLRATRPSIDVHEGDLSCWRPAAVRAFDIVQCLEVLHLILDDDGVQRAFRNFRELLTESGVVLVTVRPGEDDLCPASYLRFRPESQLRAWWESAGLVELRRLPIYYWMADGGPRWRATQPLFFRLPPRIVYALDRVALSMRLPRASTGPDSRTELVMLARKTK
jgi:SAM-dependent methyltransferase